MKFLSFDVLFKGLAMGIAEVIPGVSGGTIAFITGIYEKLMNTIRAINLEFFKDIKSGDWKKAFNTLDISFIVSLMVGMLLGIVFGIFVISYLLIHFPEPLWGFFFGLIVASALFIARQYNYKTLSALIALLIGFVIAYGITILSPVEGNYEYWFIFISGIVAISAMLLPGVSGSFMLVILGLYGFILSSMKNLLTQFDSQSLIIIGVFMSGLIIGAATFSRVFSWLFERYKHTTLAILTGFLLGSLNKIWPWKNVTQIYHKESGQFYNLVSIEELDKWDSAMIKIISEVPVWPQHYWGEPKSILTMVVCILGFLVVFTMDFYKKGKI
ncbi:MAG: DUF368 domain-containing protein [Saprospiraceae bacterium]